VPCDECLRRNIQCSFSNHDTIQEQWPRSLTDRVPSPTPDQSQTSHPDKGEQYIGLYFEAFHPFWPFIHRGSFNIRREKPLLLQSMIVIGLWTSGEQSAQTAAVELHDRLDLAIRDQKVRWPLWHRHKSALLIRIYRRIGMSQTKMMFAAPLHGP
jgi:hypothetical protein